jgi:hypothetical protein
VAALSFDEKGFVLGAAVARMPAPDAAGRVSGAAGPRCAAALAALGEASRAARAAEIAALAALVRAPVPAGIERIHPDWLRDRFEPETGDVLRAIAAGLPNEVRRLVTDVLRARGEEAHLAGPAAGVQAVAALQRVVFAGLVPLAGAGAPTTALARELAALAPADLVRAIEMRGAETLGRSLRGAPPPVLARAAAAVGPPLAALVLDAARGDGEPAARDRARRLVGAAGMAAAGEATLGIGLHALADALAEEGDAAILAVAQRLPPAVGRRLLAAANGSG